MTNEKIYLELLETSFPGKNFLSVEELAEFMECDIKSIYSWNQRPDKKRRPPKIYVGKQIKYPKQALAFWLLQESGESIERSS